MVFQLERQTILVSPQILVSSYLTFSSLPRKLGGYFLLCFLYPHRHLSFREFDTLCCPDFPHYTKYSATKQPTAVQRYYITVIIHSKITIIHSKLFIVHYQLLSIFVGEEKLNGESTFNSNN